jgi:two-component system cell cycle response regulator
VLRLPAIATRQLARVAGVLFAAAGVAAVAYLAHVYAGVGGKRADAVFSDGVYNVAMIGAAFALIMRAPSRGQDRAALLAIGTGMLLWATGDLYYTVAYSGGAEPPSPSVADALYLSYYPFLYVGLGLLIRSRFRGLKAAMWLDGLITALGLAAVATGVLLDPVLSATGGSPAVVATNLAYPLGDMLLFLVIVTGIGLSGWRPGLMWGLMAAGLLVQVTADTVYLFQVATETYAENTWLETLWPVASLLMLAGAWVPSQRVRRAGREGWLTLLVPCVGALAAIGLLYVDHGNTHVNTPARVLAVATLLAAITRVLLAFRASLHRQRESEHQAMTDALTGLGNRRRLLLDLDHALEEATPAAPWLLVLYDLNGFKLYNDSFGHPAGDVLLARLGQNLGATAAPYGRAYRMGGDEFCTLLRPGDTPVEVLTAATERALAESGDGFSISSESGVTLIPHESTEASTALALADRRLYAHKEARPAGVKHQLRGVLLRILNARTPTLVEHLEGVAALALAVGRRLDLDAESLDELVRAAEMHDIGKTAIPETILDKPGPLDEREWAFMRRHTIFGERILSAAPALVPVAKLVRSSHERWDGDGYPDGLKGEDIPLGARIVNACDAYDAITSTRSYKRARSSDEALAELQRCAGTQFDPAVVAALVEVVTNREHLATPLAQPAQPPVPIDIVTVGDAADEFAQAVAAREGSAGS